MPYQRLDSADDGTVSDEREAADRDDLMAELRRLRDENARLRSVLGLDERQTGGHAAAWSPMLVPDSQGSPFGSSQLVERLEARAGGLAVRCSLGRLRHPVGERLDWQVGLVPGNQGRMGPAT